MKIVFLDEYSVGGADLSAIKSLGDYTAYEVTTTTEETISRSLEAEVVITNKVVMSREVLSQLPHLRLICVAATGMNNVDLDAAKEFGIEVRNAVGYSSESVAEATFASALSLLRQINYYDRYVKSGEYAAADRLFCFDRTIGKLHGQNWGIIGLGAIGRKVAQIATAFGCNVRYYSTSGAQREEQTERAESLTELLEWSDIISLHSPLNPQTEGLIGADEFRSMRSNAIVINVARGGIISEQALADALNSGEIAAAAVDVFSREPIVSDSPLLSVKDPDRLILSPHNAWQAESSVRGLVEAIFENIKRYKQ